MKFSYKKINQLTELTFSFSTFFWTFYETKSHGKLTLSWRPLLLVRVNCEQGDFESRHLDGGVHNIQWKHDAFFFIYLFFNFN